MSGKSSPLATLFWDLVEYFKDPAWVVNFQRSFGIEEVHRSTVNKHQPYVALDMDVYKSMQKSKNERQSGSDKSVRGKGVTSNGGVSQIFAMS